MESLLKRFEGKKTYLAAAALAVAGVLFGLGVLTPEQFQAAVAAAMALGTYGLREALAKLRASAEPTPPVED